MMAHILLGLTATMLWPYFFLLNRTTVVGRPPRIPRNAVLVANHQSTLDGYLIALTSLWPSCLVLNRLMPWSLAANAHFFRTPVRAWFGRNLQCIPIRPGVSNAASLRRFMRMVKRSVGIYFPEGRRSPDGAIGRAHAGIGTVVLHNRPVVIPIAIDGTREAVRFDRFGLRLFRSIRIAYGDPIDFADRADPLTRLDDPRQIAEGIMERIRELYAGAQAEREEVSCSPSS